MGVLALRSSHQNDVSGLRAMPRRTGNGRDGVEVLSLYHEEPPPPQKM